MEHTYLPVEFAIGLILLVALICVGRSMPIASDAGMRRPVQHYLVTPDEPARRESSMGGGYRHAAPTTHR